jgi:dTDP-4-amino-4,6-dideoxygalactose transaminase
MSDVMMHFAPQPIPHCDLLAGVIPLRAEILAPAARVVDSGWYIPGREFRTFDQEFAKLHGGAVAIGVANGTYALCLAP